MNAEEKMLNNFIKKYGIRGLERIVELFVAKTSNEKIAEEFKVTRQRVHQWQKAFTTSTVSLKPFVSSTLRSSISQKGQNQR
jgi:hypothetical protein